MKFIVPLLFAILQCSLAHWGFTEDDCCQPVDVIIGLNSYDFRGPWYFQYAFFANLAPEQCSSGTHAYIKPVNCTHFKSETICLNSNGRESVTRACYNTFVQGISKQYRPLVPGNFTIVGYSKDEFFIQYYCHDGRFKTSRQLLVMTKSKFPGSNTLKRVEQVLKKFAIVSLDEGHHFEQLEWYPHKSSFTYTRTAPVEPDELQGIEVGEGGADDDIKTVEPGEPDEGTR